MQERRRDDAFKTLFGAPELGRLFAIELEGYEGGAAADVFVPFDPLVFGDFPVAIADVAADGGEDVVGIGVFIAIDSAVLVLVFPFELVRGSGQPRRGHVSARV